MSAFSVSIPTITAPGIIEVALSGELDAATAPTLIATGSAHAMSGCRLLVLDLNQLTFMDSSGLSALIHIRNVAAHADVELVLQRARNNIVRVLEITGVTQIFTVDTGDVAQTGKA